MRQRILDLAVVLSAQGDVLASTGQAIMAHKALPHPVLKLIEDLYPREVAKARFRALWSERDSGTPDATAIGTQFKEELAAAFKLKGQLREPYTLVIEEPPV